MLKVFSLVLLLIAPLPSLSASDASRGAQVLTVRQYTAFLQATAASDRYGLYNEKMGSDILSACILRHGEPGCYCYEVIPEHEEDPVPYISHLSAKRYCNWLQNDQPIGEQDETTTEQGAYTLDGTMEADPEKEEMASYFIAAASNDQVDPSLSSNLKSYVIVTHIGDTFQVSTSSHEEKETWTTGEIIAGVIGIAAVTAAILHPREAMHGAERESEGSNHLTSEETTAAYRSREESREAGSCVAHPEDPIDSTSTNHQAETPLPWSDSTEITIDGNFLKWLANELERINFLEHTQCLTELQQRRIKQSAPWISDFLISAKAFTDQHAQSVKDYYHLMKLRLVAAPTDCVKANQRHNQALAKWLWRYHRSSLYKEYANFFTFPKELYQKTWVAYLFQSPEHCHAEAYKTFHHQLAETYQINYHGGKNYWPYEVLLQEWKTSSTAPWRQLVEREEEALQLLKKYVTANQKKVSFKLSSKKEREKKIFAYPKPKGVFLSDYHKASVKERLFAGKRQKKASLKILIPELINKQLQEATPETKAFYQTIKQNYDSEKSAPWEWEDEAAWQQFQECFSKSDRLIKELVYKKTTLMNDADTWKERNYGPHPRLLRVLKQEATDIWKEQVQTIEKELREVVNTAGEIYHGRYTPTSILPLKIELTNLTLATFRHLKKIQKHMESNRTILDPSEQDRLALMLDSREDIKAWFALWEEDLIKESSRTFIPNDYDSSLKLLVKIVQSIQNFISSYAEPVPQVPEINTPRAPEIFETSQQTQAQQHPLNAQTSSGSLEENTDTEDTTTSNTHATSSVSECPSPFNSLDQF